MCRFVDAAVVASLGVLLFVVLLSVRLVVACVLLVVASLSVLLVTACVLLVVVPLSVPLVVACALVVVALLSVLPVVACAPLVVDWLLPAVVLVLLSVLLFVFPSSRSTERVCA